MTLEYQLAKQSEEIAKLVENNSAPPSPKGNDGASMLHTLEKKDGSPSPKDNKKKYFLDLIKLKSTKREKAFLSSLVKSFQFTGEIPSCILQALQYISDKATFEDFAREIPDLTNVLIEGCTRQVKWIPLGQLLIILQELKN